MASGGLRALALLLLVAAPALRAQESSSLGDLAELLAAEDRREFDIGLFQRAAQHPDRLVRSRAALAAGRIGDWSATPVLVRLLADEDTSVRVEAAFAMGELGDRAAVPELARQLEALPAGAAGPWAQELPTALAKLGGPDADAALLRLLQRHPPETGDNDPATSGALLEAWRLPRSSRTAARLPDYIRNAGDLWRQNAAYSAGRLRMPEATSGLLEAAADANVLTRAYALRGLLAPLADSAGVARDAFVARIRPLLTDEHAQVRINALRALGSFADSGLAQYAAPRLIDRDPNVPVQAAATLGALGGSRAVQALADRLREPAPFALRRALLLGLAQAAPESAFAAARPLARETDWRLRLLFVEVLGSAATPASRTAALEMVAGDPDARVVAGALGALGEASEPADTAVLAAARGRMADPDAVVRSAAIDLLARERTPQVVPELVNGYRRAERDQLDDARLSAVNALAQIWRLGGQAAEVVVSGFLAAVPRSSDYLVRRAVADRFGAALHRRYWGAVPPVETGRSAEDYREAVRRYVLGTTAAGPMRAVIETDRGDLVIELHAADAPLTVDNFVRLVDRRYFDNGRWHRVVPNFVVQDGDPRGDGSGGPGTVIRDEINRWRYGRGVVGMALSGPDTGGSQFFITHSPQPHLDGGYTVFGHVVAGLDVLDQITQGDRIRRIVRQ